MDEFEQSIVNWTEFSGNRRPLFIFNENVNYHYYLSKEDIEKMANLGEDLTQLHFVFGMKNDKFIPFLALNSNGYNSRPPRCLDGNNAIYLPLIRNDNPSSEDTPCVIKGYVDALRSINTAEFDDVVKTNGGEKITCINNTDDLRQTIRVPSKDSPESCLIDGIMDHVMKMSNGGNISIKFHFGFLENSGRSSCFNQLLQAIDTSCCLNNVEKEKWREKIKIKLSRVNEWPKIAVFTEIYIPDDPSSPIIIGHSDHVFNFNCPCPPMCGIC